jgi:cytochrome c oxidase subunit 3
LAKKAMEKENRSKTNLYLFSTLILGIAFVYFQYQGYMSLTRMGLFFTGPNSKVSSSLFDVIAFAHAIHIIVGLLVILVLLIKNYQKKYNAVNHLGITLGEIFWHFLGALWVFLFIFFLLVI